MMPRQASSLSLEHLDAYISLKRAQRGRARAQCFALALSIRRWIHRMQEWHITIRVPRDARYCSERSLRARDPSNATSTLKERSLSIHARKGMQQKARGFLRAM
jgi:hypothetical protein